MLETMSKDRHVFKNPTLRLRKDVKKGCQDLELLNHFDSDNSFLCVSEATSRRNGTSVSILLSFWVFLLNILVGVYMLRRQFCSSVSIVWLSLIFLDLTSHGL